MSSKIKAVDIGHSPNNHNAVVDTVPDEVAEQAKIEENVPVIEEEAEIPNEPEAANIEGIIEEATEKPKSSRKMITCPDCGKRMYEKNFRYQHINVCGKVKTPKLRAKPIEEVIKEKREKVKPTDKPAVVEELPPPPLPPPVKPTYLELRREYNNQLKERKQQLVKRLVSKAF